MPPNQDEIRVAPTNDEHNPIVVVNGKEVVVSSATEKPKRSLWVAWLYLFDVRIGVRTLDSCLRRVYSGTQAIIPPRKRDWCESLIASYSPCAVCAFTSNGLIRMRSTRLTGLACEKN